MTYIDDTVDRLDPGPEDGEGVQRDALMEARIEAEHHLHLMREIVVATDYVIDDPEVVPEEAFGVIEEMHLSARTLVQMYSELLAALREREREVRG